MWQYIALLYSFPNLESVCCSMSSSKCCFLTCIQIAQEACQVVWYSHLFKNFPQFVVICIVKSFSVVSEAEIDVFLELSCFFDDPTDVGNLISDSSAFCKTSLNIWKFTVHILLKCGLENFEHYFCLRVRWTIFIFIQNKVVILLLWCPYLCSTIFFLEDYHTQ